MMRRFLVLTHYPEINTTVLVGVRARNAANALEKAKHAVPFLAGIRGRTRVEERHGNEPGRGAPGAQSLGGQSKKGPLGEKKFRRQRA